MEAVILHIIYYNFYLFFEIFKYNVISPFHLSTLNLLHLTYHVSSQLHVLLGYGKQNNLIKICFSKLP